MSDLDIDGYAHTLLDEVKAEADSSETSLQGAFTQLILDQLCAEGHTEDAVSVRVSDRSSEISGYGTSSDERCLDLFFTQYSPRADDQ